MFDKPILGVQGVVVAHASAVDTKGSKTLKDIVGNRCLSDVLWVRKNNGYDFALVGGNVVSKAKDVISKGIGSIIAGVESAINNKNVKK